MVTALEKCGFYNENYIMFQLQKIVLPGEIVTWLINNDSKT